jgi:N-acetylneuraminic acid mutarotase
MEFLMKSKPAPMTLKLLLIGLIFLFSCHALISDSNSLAADEPPIGPAKLAWSSLPNLPNALGVAGPFVGVHNDALIVAGGANFPQPVWDTQKNWLDQIWILTETERGMKWQSGGKLPRALGYGAAVSTPRGVVCIGGNDKNQNYRDVFLLQWDVIQQQLTSREYPPLPSPFAYGQATMVGEVIYVAGGQSGLQLDSAMNIFWSLDLSHHNDPDKFQWRELRAMPTYPRAFNITTHQHNGEQDCVYVIGGRHQVEGAVRFLSDVWEFNPKTQSWRQRADVPRNVAAGTGIGFGQREIFILGGDDGSLFAKTEELKDQHPGFRKESLLYSTEADTWTSSGATPQNHVTTIPVVWKNRIIIASGEVRPRVRTPAVWSVAPIEK